MPQSNEEKERRDNEDVVADKVAVSCIRSGGVLLSGTEDGLKHGYWIQSLLLRFQQTQSTM